VRESLELLISVRLAAGIVYVGTRISLASSRGSPVLSGARCAPSGLDGLELQRQLENRSDVPIVFITGHGDVPMTVRAMKAGAVSF